MERVYCMAIRAVFFGQEHLAKNTIPQVFKPNKIMAKLNKISILFAGLIGILGCIRVHPIRGGHLSAPNQGSMDNPVDTGILSRRIAAQRTRDLLMAHYYVNLENRRFGVWYKSAILETLMAYSSQIDGQTEDPKPSKFLEDSFNTIDPDLKNYAKSQIDYSRHYRGPSGPVPNFYPRYGNDFMDESLLWGLVWARAAQFVDNPNKYIDTAKNIFAYVDRVGPSPKCAKNGWQPMRWGPTLDLSSDTFLKNNAYYVNAITNEFYIALAVELYERVGDKVYLEKAVSSWNWFKESGLITSDHLIVDGLNDKCVNDATGAVYSYNHGVILAGLTGLYKATKKREYLDWAYRIARAYLRRFNTNQVVTESIGPSSDGNKDGHLFKGYFVRNLGYLAKNTPENDLRRIEAIRYLNASATAVWSNRNKQNSFGYVWEKPHLEGGIEPTLLASGLEAILAAEKLNSTEILPQVCFYDRVLWERRFPAAEQYCFAGELPWQSAYPNDSYASLRVLPHSRIRVFQHGVSADQERGWELEWEGGRRGLYISWLSRDYSLQISSFSLYRSSQ
jgi:hypothetical protein